jgi:hypothetical protein
MQGQNESERFANGLKTHLLEQCPVVFRVPDKPEARGIFEALREEAAFVVDAGIVGTANRFEPSRAKNFGGRVKERLCELAIILAIKEPEKSGPVSIVFIVCAVDDSGDPANRLAVAPGKKRVISP